ncbi:MAG: riboflavin synthase [candidate division WOR-3 bacterium]|nr:riboflavin synthase [candidate division WOR-3 bacterium]
MFTGIIEYLGKVISVRTQTNNRIFTISAPFSSELKASDSIAVNGCCLTVIDTQKDMFQVEAVAETLKMTNLSLIKIGDYVNLERARRLSDRLEGHIVQGHIDEKARITNIRKMPGLVTIEIQTSKSGSKNIVEKGSVAVDGISLTVANIKGQKVGINIIPYTYDHTNLKYKRISDWVNIEFDIIGKYVKQHLQSLRTKV